jgi:hypothetical protein
MEKTIEAAARAIAEQGGSANWEHALDCARAAIAAIMPAIGERMAVCAEGHAATGYMSDRERSYCREHGDEIGEQLRALASTMAAEVGK